MSNTPINQLEVQVVLEDGAYLRWQTKKGGVDRQTIERILREILATITRVTEKLT